MPDSLLPMIATILDVYGVGFPVGLLIAACGALFGVFVVLKRVVFIGVTLSEAAACGIALGLLLGWHPFLGALLTAMIVVVSLGLPFERWLKLPRDTLLGVLFVAFSAGSIVLVAKSGFGLEKVKTLLFGSLLFASPQDLLVIVAVLIPCAAWLLVSLRPTTYAFLDPDAAQVLGIPVRLLEMLFFVTLGAVVAASSKIAGVLLIFCYLVVAPGVALLLWHRLPGVLLLSVATACGTTIAGILVSYRFDLPPNQTIGLGHCLVFLLAVIGRSGLPILGWKRGAPFVLVSCLATLVWLMHLPVAIVEAGSEAVAQSVASASIPVSACACPECPGSSWISETERLVHDLKTSGRKAVAPALDFLRRDPPLLFRTQVHQALEQVLQASSGWDIRQPASATANLAAYDACLSRVNSFDHCPNGDHAHD